MSLAYAKGSPGVSTTAAAFAAVEVAAGRSACWVELDPSGGTGRIQVEGPPRSTLTEFARGLREGRSPGGWVDLAVEAPPGVPAVLAQAGAKAASTVIGEGLDRWAEAFAAAPGTVVVDCGRWDADQRSASRLEGADVVGLVCRSTVESVEHARLLVNDLRRTARCPVGVVVVGTSPYSGGEVARALHLPLAGVVEWRRADVAALWARGREGVRSLFGRSVSRTLGGLVGMVQGPYAAPAPRPAAGTLRGRGR